MGEDQAGGLTPDIRVGVVPLSPLLADDLFGEIGHFYK